jgi:glycosyltransferase involved in cell wall biosynthesis
MKVYYWSPHLSKVATVKAVFNSCKSLNAKGIEAKIINVAGEWEFIEKKYRIDLHKKFKLLKFIRTEGYYYSRMASVMIFFISLIPLYFFLKKNKPEFLIVHLLTSIPLLLKKIFNIKTKLILRISGLPRLNLFRRNLWKSSEKNIWAITSPTIETKNRLIKQKIFSSKKIFLLRDPIINEKNYRKNINRNYKKKKNFLAIGRLSKQKNFLFLIKNFEKMSKKYKDISLTIIGEGEDRAILEKFIKDKNLNHVIKLVGYKNNVMNYYKKYDCFILSSIWEDPGFVLVEAANLNMPIIASNCMSGPTEISNNGKNMFLFQNNNNKDFIKKFSTYMNIKNLELKKMCNLSKKFILNFTINEHKSTLLKILKKRENEEN